MQANLKTWLHVIGSAIGLCGVVFVVIRLNTYAGQIDLTRFSLKGWSVLASLALLYGAATTFLVQAWRELLTSFGIRVEQRWAIRTYGLAQLAKYVPGNILHLAGRQALGLAAGLPGAPLAKSVAWELVLFAGAGALFGGLGTALVQTGFPATVLLPVFATALLAGVAVLRRLWSAAVAAAVGWQLTFLTVSSLAFVTIAAFFTPWLLTPTSGLTLASAFVVAWLAGLVTPGAPAGVGVRELVLLFLLKGMMVEADLLVAVVLGRIVTVMGDLLFFLFAYLLPKPVNGRAGSSSRSTPG